MTSRLLALLGFAVMASGCGGAREADPTAADQAAIAKLHEDYATHFNAHHASVVADLMSDSAVALMADGSVDMGRAAILAGLEETMAASPTLTLRPAETRVFGDRAATIGGYSIGMTPPGGAAVTLSGNYMTQYLRENGTWKIRAVLTNYDAPPPEGLPRDTVMTTPPPDAGTMASLVGPFAEHYNMGHASVVAALFADSAWAAFADTPAGRGRAGVEAYLAGQIANGAPQLTVHDVATTALSDGWALDGGWWEATATTPDGPRTRRGTYMLLASQAADQSWRIEWFISNGAVVPPAPK